MLSQDAVFQCINFELLFSPKEVILAFDVADLPFIPEKAQNLMRVASGWEVEFNDLSNQTVVVSFVGAPEVSLKRASLLPTLLIVGLQHNPGSSPSVVMNEELSLSKAP
jgi:hypothetical protein